MVTDRLFLIAIATGPGFWLALPIAGIPVTGPGWVMESPGLFLSAVLFFPVIEEVVFRGMLQEVLAERLPSSAVGPWSSANLLTSGLFSAMHLLTHPVVWAIGAFFPSLLFGYFKERHGRLASPITLHSFYNAGFFALFGGG